MRVVGCWGYVPWVAGDMFQVAGDMFRCDGGKTKSTPSPTNLYWTVRLDWSLTTKSSTKPSSSPAQPSPLTQPPQPPPQPPPLPLPPPITPSAPAEVSCPTAPLFRRLLALCVYQEKVGMVLCINKVASYHKQHFILAM